MDNNVIEKIKEMVRKGNVSRILRNAWPAQVDPGPGMSSPVASLFRPTSATYLEAGGPRFPRLHTFASGGGQDCPRS